MVRNIFSRWIAVSFIVVGVLWFAAIQIRCEEIMPKPALVEAVSEVAVEVPVVVKVRSPHAKWYHDAFFWAIAVTEVFIASFYVAAGALLFKKLVLARFVSQLVLTLHVLFVGSVVAYMRFASLPLSRLTGNEELLKSYFLPSGRWHNIFAIHVNGFRWSQPEGWIYVLVLAGVWWFCLKTIKDSVQKGGA